MLRSSTRARSLLLLLPLTACTGMGGPGALEARQALLEVNAKGIPVSAFVAIDPVACGDAGPEFRLSGEVTATDALSLVELVVEIDGVEIGRQPLAESKSLEKKGDLKAAVIEDLVSVPGGRHVVHMCLSQKGEKSPAQKGACVPEFVYVADCESAVPPDGELPPDGEVPPDTTLPPDEGSDFTAPTIAAERSSLPNESGWYNAPVTVTFACEDAESGIASCSAPVTLSTEGVEHFARGQAKDVAGNVVGRAEGPIRIDLTPPTIMFAGARSYSVDETIEVSCVASDALSGLKTSSCMTSLGEAFLLPLGAHTVSGRAIDLAGNSVEASAEFSVNVTSDGLCEIGRASCREREEILGAAGARKGRGSNLGRETGTRCRTDARP